MQQAQVQAPAWQYAKWLNSPYHRDKQVALRHAYENLPLDQLMGFFVWVKHFWNVLDHREKEMAAQIRARIINEANALTMQGYQIQIPAGLLDPMIGNPYAYPAGLGGYAHQGLGDFWADFSKAAENAAGNAAISAINYASQQATNALNQSTTQSQTNDGWDFDIPGLNQNTTPSTPQGQPSQQGAYYDPYEMGYQPQGQPQTFQYGPQPYTPPATAPTTAPTTTTPATTTAAGTTATVPTAAAASSWQKYIPWAIGAGALYLLLKPRRRSAYRS